jgi:hypothetical protein
MPNQAVNWEETSNQILKRGEPKKAHATLLFSNPYNSDESEDYEKINASSIFCRRTTNGYSLILLPVNDNHNVYAQQKSSRG